MNDMPVINIPVALFHPGKVYVTPGATDATSHEYRLQCLSQHLSGDWGCCSAEDKAANTKALSASNAIQSAYPIDPGQPSKGWGANTLWVITESDRSKTTILLPSER